MGRVIARSRRGYIDVNIDVTETVRVSDVIDQIEDVDLINEVQERCLIKPKPMELSRESISDFFGKSRYTPLPELMKLLQEKLEAE